MGIFESVFGSFLIAFPALFSIVNPLGGALIYSQVTADRSHPERVRLAWRVALYSAGVMLVALWAGASLIGFFGVTLSALRIGGGLVVATRAWELLSAPQQQEDRKQAQAAPAAGAEDVAFFPLTVPFTAGPGAISVAIALSASRPTRVLDLLPHFAGSSWRQPLSRDGRPLLRLGGSRGGVAWPRGRARGDPSDRVPAALHRCPDRADGRSGRPDTDPGPTSRRQSLRRLPGHSVHSSLDKGEDVLGDGPDDEGRKSLAGNALRAFAAGWAPARQPPVATGTAMEPSLGRRYDARQQHTT